ncbi:MAG: FAD-dependent monooxygenase [Bacteroidia bacterium]|nr:FAD-dependent monooxygenase [Bacteroidia bacterium]
MSGQRIHIIGAGICGLTAAAALHQRGYEVAVYERAAALQPVGAGLVLASNAMRALKSVGLDELVIPEGALLERMSIRDHQGREITRADTTTVTRQYGIHNFTIHRADLQRVLLSQLPEGCVHTGKACVQVSQAQQQVTARFTDGTTAVSDILLVTDGIHSAVRQYYFPFSKPRYAGYTCWRGVTSHIPEGLEKNVATETWGPAGRVGIVPMSRDRIYWFACVNAPQGDETLKNWKSAELATAFAAYHAPIPELLQKTPDEAIIWNDILDIKPISRFAFGRALLMGDAAHATTPNMGQGACQAIEDVAVLVRCLDQYDNTEDALRMVEARRRARTARIINQSWSLGKLAQMDKPRSIAFRNFMLRMVPPAVNDLQLRWLYHVAF